MSTESHIVQLREKHATLKQQIDDEFHRPEPDSIRISDLKKQKLRIKDEIAKLESEPTH
jgi:hypothetical protein